MTNRQCVCTAAPDMDHPAVFDVIDSPIPSPGPEDVLLRILVCTYVGAFFATPLNPSCSAVVCKDANLLLLEIEVNISSVCLLLRVGCVYVELRSGWRLLCGKIRLEVATTKQNVFCYRDLLTDRGEENYESRLFFCRCRGFLPSDSPLEKMSRSST